MKFVIKPVQGSTNIVRFTDAVIVFALAQSCAAKVETQDRKPETVQRFHGMKDDFVLKRASVKRMRMTDQSSMAGVI